MKFSRIGMFVAVIMAALGANGFAQTSDSTVTTPVFVSQEPSPPVQSVHQPLMIPGSAWSALGNISPTEKGNIINQSSVEQGIALYHSDTFSVVPYVSSGLIVDSKGKDWDNRVTAQAGIGLNRGFANGIIMVRAGYALEHRWKSGSTNSAPMVSVSDWFGWNQQTVSASPRFPGSTWATVGNISPVEKDNIIGQLHLQQGVAVGRIGRIPVVPFVEGTLTRDTKRYDWDNRALYGGGLKLVILGGPQASEVGVSYVRETRFNSGLTAHAVMGFVRFWTGWR